MTTILSVSDFNLNISSVLGEVDKHLRSNLISDQFEGISKVPSIFERYPFPILINPVALRLSELFKTGNNFMRSTILNVLKDTEKHLDKILNITQFVDHIFEVSYSNDPLARSITLKTMSHIARIVANHKNIHQLIRNSLESKNNEEILAAIDASVKFAIESKEFSENVYPKVIYMIEDLKTPIEIKIHLLNVIKNLHPNISIVEDARMKLISILKMYPDKNYVNATFYTLTSLAILSKTHISDQVELLLFYYTEDSRLSVKLSMLENLQILANENVRLWEKSSLKNFIDIVCRFEDSDFECKKLKLLLKSFCVLRELFGSKTLHVDKMLFESIFTILNFCNRVIFLLITPNELNKEFKISLISIFYSVLSNITVNYHSQLQLFNSNCRLVLDTCSLLLSFFLLQLSLNNSCENTKELRTIFKNIMILCQTLEESVPKTIRQVVSMLTIFVGLLLPSGYWYGLFCGTICSLPHVVQKNQLLVGNKILNIIGTDKIKPIEVNKLALMYFQYYNGKYIDKVQAYKLIKCLSKFNTWDLYRVVRSAMRFGHHNIALKLLKQFKPISPNEISYFWIQSLKIIAEAESSLLDTDTLKMKNADFLDVDFSNDLLEKKIKKSIENYSVGLNHLNASPGSSKFKSDYINCRMKYFKTHQFFQKQCELILILSERILVIESDQSVFKLLRNNCDTLQNCSNQFRETSNLYTMLYQSSFDADPNSLENIQLLQHSCIIMAEMIDNFFQRSSRIDTLYLPKGKHKIFEHKELEDICTSILQMVQSETLKSFFNTEPKCDKMQLILEFKKQIEMLLRISAKMSLIQLPFPRYFFQQLQYTDIKLEFSLDRSMDMINIGQGVKFVMNVEGVITTLNARKTASIDLKPMENTFRKIMKILVKFNATLITNNDSSTTVAPSLSMNSIATPLNDYFHVQLLLTFNDVGQYNVTLETFIIDENEIEWKIGDVKYLTAKVVEDYNQI